MQAKFGTGDSAIAEVGRYKYIFVVTDAPGAAKAKGSAFWIGSGSGDGWNGTTTLSIQVGTTDASPAFNTNYEIPATSTTITGNVRRINIYDSLVGASKVFAINNTTNLVGEQSAIANAELITAGGQDYNNGTSYFKNQYNAQLAGFTSSSWATNAKYVLKLTLSGTTADGTVDNACPEIWNVFDATQGDSSIIKSVDDSAYNLNSLSITSDLSIGTGGQYFKSITRKGKVFVVKTGLEITEVGFSSVALGDESKSTAFGDQGPSTLYGHLHKIRNIQAEAVPVYWDEPQKDGTFVRMWGKITNVNETRGTGGPRAVMSYTFTLVVEKIALIKNNGLLMSDIYPLGGLKYERDYS